MELWSYKGKQSKHLPYSRSFHGFTDDSKSTDDSLFPPRCLSTQKYVQQVHAHNQGIATRTSTSKNIERRNLMFALHTSTSIDEGDSDDSLLPAYWPSIERFVQIHNQGFSTPTSKNVEQNNLPFVLHNTEDTIMAVDDAFLIGYQKLKCPRCKKLAELARKSSKKHTVIDINNISGICDHCKTNEPSKVCDDCTCALRNHLAKKNINPGDYVPVIESWLSKTEKKLKQTGHSGLHPKAESKLVLEEITNDKSTFLAILLNDQKQGAKELTGKEIKKNKINIEQIRGKNIEDKDFKFLFPTESVKEPRAQISSSELIEKTRKTLHKQAEKNRISNEEKLKRNKILEEKKRKKLEERKKRSKEEREKASRSVKTESSQAIIQSEVEKNNEKQTETLIRPKKSESYQEIKSKEAKKKTISDADNKKIPEADKKKQLEEQKKEKLAKEETLSPTPNKDRVRIKTPIEEEEKEKLKTEETLSPTPVKDRVRIKSVSDTKLIESNLEPSDEKTVRAKSGTTNVVLEKKDTTKPHDTTDFDGIKEKKTKTEKLEKKMKDRPIKPSKSKSNTIIAKVTQNKTDISEKTKTQVKTEDLISVQQTKKELLEKKAKLLQEKAELLKIQKEKEAASKARQAERRKSENLGVDMKSIKVTGKDSQGIAIKGHLQKKTMAAVPLPDVTAMLSKRKRVESSDSDDSNVADYYTTIKNMEPVTEMILKQRILTIDLARKQRPMQKDNEAFLFKTVVKVDGDSKPSTETARSGLGQKALKSPETQPEEETHEGIIKYALSDKRYIDNGWTVLPVQTVLRKMNVYRMRPARPEFDWFEHNKHKGQMVYDTGERLAEFDENGHGTWYYRNGNLALEYYDAEGPNANQRIVVYSSGEPDECGRSPGTFFMSKLKIPYSK